MTASTKGVLLALLLSAIASPLRAQGSYTAASCNYSDVNAIIHGPTHIAVDGDVINIPVGTCTWTSSLSITAAITLIGNGTPNTTSSTFGSGTLNTVIVDNASSYMIQVTGLTYGKTARISTLDIEPNSSSTSLSSPITASGTCNSSGCPQIRIDNIGFGITTQWTEGGNSSSADWMIRTDNIFGVIDHCTIPANSNVELFNANLSAYLGTGGYGDNSWAQPDTMGGANVLYAENNIADIAQALDDCDTAPAGGGIGGCRIAVRYNHVTFESGAFALSIVHGLDTDGRPRSGRQQEAYGNTINGPSNSGFNTATVGFRGGTGIVFGNTMTFAASASLNQIASLNIYRTVFTAGGGWGACGGSSPYDTSDHTVYYSGTTTSGSSGTTLNDTTKNWTINQLAPNGASYSVYDVTQNFWAEILSNTATQIIIQPNIPEQTNSFNVGDSYQILRATVCADQAGRGQGGYVSGTTPSPASALNQALDPIYEWDDTSNKTPNYGNMAESYTAKDIANRDWYSDNSLGTPHAQTSSTSPFSCNGSTGGVGWGTLARRPSSCSGACAVYTPGCGYFATDQGPQGTLYVWSSGAWTGYYTPYIYPHPLTQVTGPAPPTNLQAIP